MLSSRSSVDAALGAMAGGNGSNSAASRVDEGAPAESGGGGNMGGSKVSGARGAISRAIVRDNMRRFWPLGLVSLIIYLAGGPLPRILSMSQAETIRITPGFGSGEFAGFALIGVIFAAIAAVTVFRYIHSASALSVVHALPIERRVLFFSNFLSGLILSLVPFIISALTMLAFINETKNATAWLNEWATWLLAVCVTIFFTYAASVLAGMVSGNTPAHILTAGIFNFAWLFIYQLAVLQAMMFLYGLSAESDFTSAGSYFHPFMYFMGSISEIEMVVGANPALPMPAGFLVYLFASVAVSAAAYLVFLRFKAERAGRSITARPIEYVFVFVITALGMLVGAMLFTSFDPVSNYSDGQLADPMTYVSPYYVVGSVIGAVVAFIVATMVLRKSPRVFDLPALRRFGIFAVAAALFIVCVTTNITGFETRVPNATDVKTAAFHVANPLAPPYKYGGINALYGSGGSSGSMFAYISLNIPIKGESDVEALAAFHRKALEDRAYLYDPTTDEVDIIDVDGGSNQAVDIGYGLESGGEELRSYVFSGKYLLESDEYARLLSSDSVKGYMSIKNLLGYDSLNTPMLYYGTSYNMYSVGPDTDVRNKLTANALRELAACLDEDYRAMSMNDMMDPGNEIFTLGMSSSRLEGTVYESARGAITGKGQNAQAIAKEMSMSKKMGVLYTITDKSVKTVAWLKEKGVYDSLVKSTEELKKSWEEDRAETDSTQTVEVL